MAPKGNKGPKYTPFKDSFVCTKCNKTGNGYQCSFCENYRTCGECGVCNVESCAAKTKVIKAPEEKLQQTAAVVTPPKNIPGLAKTNSPKPKAEKKADIKDVFVDQLAAKKERKDEKKAAEKRDRNALKQVPVQSPKESKKKAATVETGSPSSSSVPATSFREVLAQMDLAEIGKTAGNLVALKALLESYCLDCGLVAKIGTFPSTMTLDEPYCYTSRAMRKALDQGVRSTDVSALDLANQMYSKLLEEIVRDHRKPEAQKGQGYARLLLAQVIAKVYPTVVAYTADQASKGLAKYESQQTAIPAMWMLAQARGSNTVATVEAWHQYVLPALLAIETGDKQVRQYATNYTNLLVTLGIHATERGLKMDILTLLQKAYGTNHDEYSKCIMTDLPFFQSTWVKLSSNDQLEDTLKKIILFFEKKPAPEQASHGNAVVDLTCEMLRERSALFAFWQAQAEDRRAHATQNQSVAFLVGSKHLAIAMMARPMFSTLNTSALVATFKALATTGEKFRQSLGKATEKKGDAATKVDNVVLFFQSLAKRVSPSVWPARLLGLFVLIIMGALVLKTNAHCTRFPCSEIRVCGPYHPCTVLRQPEVSHVLDTATVELESLGEVAWEHAQPALPYVATANLYMQENVVKPITPHAKKALAMTEVFVENAVVPMASQVYTQAKPHLDTAAKWTEANVVPQAKVIYTKSLDQLDLMWAWSQVHVVAPGMVYGEQAIRWSEVHIRPESEKAWTRAKELSVIAMKWLEVNVCPHTEKAWIATKVVTIQAKEYVEVNVYPKAIELATQASERGQEEASKLMANINVWYKEAVMPAYEQTISNVRAETSTWVPRANQWYQEVAMPAVDEAKTHVMATSLRVQEQATQMVAQAKDYYTTVVIPATANAKVTALQYKAMAMKKAAVASKEFQPWIQKNVVPKVNNAKAIFQMRIKQAKIQYK
eukprot:Ihof_evm1s249 gene=Ihof_evmTU1s249